VSIETSLAAQSRGAYYAPMREGLPSGTSFVVSFARGLGVDDEVLDPIAKDLLPTWLGRMADAPRRLGGASSFYRRAVRATTFGLIDHAVLRTQAIDAHLASALRSGIDQVVILGAGLDARAWRLPVLGSKTVFEVDHPATQQYKQRRIGGRTPRAEVRYVAVDFEKERFSEGLEGAGFRLGDPTMWIWEGVAMYLPLNAIRDTLGQLTRLSAAGSELAMTYRVPGMLPFGALGRAAIPALFKAAGEPLKGTLEPQDLVSTVAPAWDVVYDDDARGWQKLTGSVADPARSFLGERLAIARKKPFLT
jgi:methyltransferase (TIGR00027 family)